jgi:hypothetical protein
VRARTEVLHSSADKKRGPSGPRAISGDDNFHFFVAHLLLILRSRLTCGGLPCIPAEHVIRAL